MSYLLASRLDRLRAEGHPKWRDVEVTALPPGWDVAGCVLDGLAPGYAFRCERPDGTVAEEAAAAATEPNRLFLQRVCAFVDC